MIKPTPMIIAAKSGWSIENPPRANDIIPRTISNTEAIFDICESEIIPIIPAKIIIIPMMQNCNPKRNDNAAMLDANINPTIMAIIPTTIFIPLNPASINAIPKKIRLIPMKIETNAVLKIGQIIKINPKIMDNIPDILVGSIFFLQ